jgi:hypothetical protein
MMDILCGNGMFKEGREDEQDDPGSGQPKTQRPSANVDRVRTFVRSDRRSGVRLTAEEPNMNKETRLFEEKDPNSSLSCGFSTMTMPLNMMCLVSASSLLTNPFQKWTNRLLHLTALPLRFSAVSKIKKFPKVTKLC